MSKVRIDPGGLGKGQPSPLIDRQVQYLKSSVEFRIIAQRGKFQAYSVCRPAYH